MAADPMECNFPRARSLIHILRETCHKKTGKITRLSRYFISSRKPESVTPEQWIHDIRGHWAGVEIRNHWKKDAILFEDKTRSRRPNIVGSLALLRAALLLIFHRLNPIHGSLPATLEYLRENRAASLQAIFKSLL